MMASMPAVMFLLVSTERKLEKTALTVFEYWTTYRKWGEEWGRVCRYTSMRYFAIK